jgi:hypothetical protein
MSTVECAYCGTKRPKTETRCPGCDRMEVLPEFPQTSRRLPPSRWLLGELTAEVMDHNWTDLIGVRLWYQGDLVADITLSKSDLFRAIPPGTDGTPFFLDALTAALTYAGREDLVPRLRADRQPVRFTLVPFPYSEYAAADVAYRSTKTPQGGE